LHDRQRDAEEVQDGDAEQLDDGEKDDVVDGDAAGQRAIDAVRRIAYKPIKNQRGPKGIDQRQQRAEGDQE
jgi:hypothetical protein